MASSPFCKPFQERISMWAAKLTKMQKILDEWLTTQVKWMYLGPVFGTDEISKKMPKERKDFMSADGKYRRIMLAVLNSPEVLNICGMDGLLEDLIESNKVCEFPFNAARSFITCCTVPTSSALGTKGQMHIPKFCFVNGGLSIGHCGSARLLEVLVLRQCNLARDPYQTTAHMCYYLQALSTVEKSLARFLDSIKSAFARFWFLSNDELLEIISETASSAERVQPFVKKCFEAVQSLQFESNLAISGCTSIEGEVIVYDSTVDPTGEANGVELWLLQVCFDLCPAPC